MNPFAGLLPAEIPANHKRCKACLNVKPCDRFSPRTDHADGRLSTCRDCVNERDRMRRADKRDPNKRIARYETEEERREAKRLRERARSMRRKESKPPRENKTPPEVIQKSKAYYWANRDKILAKLAQQRNQELA